MTRVANLDLGSQQQILKTVSLRSHGRMEACLLYVDAQMKHKLSCWHGEAGFSARSSSLFLIRDILKMELKFLEPQDQQMFVE